MLSRTGVQEYGGGVDAVGRAVAVLFDRLPGIISGVEAELAKAEA